MDAPPVKPCTWTEGADYGPWYTACGQVFWLEDGTPADNKMAFCCFCGHPLQSLPFHEPCVGED